MKTTPKKKTVNDKWEKRKLGASAKFTRKVSVQREAAVDEALGLQLISLRLQKNIDRRT